MNNRIENLDKPTYPMKAFLSKVIANQLSRHLDFNNYDVKCEGCLENENPSSEKSDVVVYRKDTFQPVAAIEICRTDDLTDSFVISKKLRNQYSLEEFFIYDYEADLWCREAKNFTQSGFSIFLNIDLKGMVSLFLAGKDSLLK